MAWPSSSRPVEMELSRSSNSLSDICECSRWCISALQTSLVRTCNARLTALSRMSQRFAIGSTITESWLARPLRRSLTLWRTADPSQPRLDAIKGFRRAGHRASEDYLELKQTRADAEAQLAELNRTTQDRAAWRRDRDTLAMRLRGGERLQMAVLLLNGQVIGLFKRFKRS